MGELLKCERDEREEAVAFDIHAKGKRKQDIGLVVPSRYTARKPDKRAAEVLMKEIGKKGEKYTRFDLEFEETRLVKVPLYIIYFL